MFDITEIAQQNEVLTKACTPQFKNYVAILFFNLEL